MDALSASITTLSVVGEEGVSARGGCALGAEPVFQILMPLVGLEPTRDYSHVILSHARIPFRHSGVSIKILL